jgi:hypothetical protein
VKILKLSKVGMSTLHLSGVQPSVNLKNKQQKDLCLKEIGLHAHNMFYHSNLESQHN